jgi:GNAT superfamily N-acetyltransferase
MVVLYDPRYKDVFRKLNLAWIEKYFRVESKDIEQTDNPEECLKQGGQIFFIVDGERAVGTCAMYLLSPKIYELAKMAVDPAYQGHGYGDALMIAAEDWVRAQGGTEIHILSNTVLEPAIRLYHKHGYVTTHLGPHPDYERANIELKKKL